MRILVTGGAGYIGSHTVSLLRARGDDVVIADDLSTGLTDRVPGIPIVQVDLAASGAVDILARAMTEHRVDAVIHFAAKKQVGESVHRPAWYYQQNVGGMAQLLMAMELAQVSKLVFSSSAAVYQQSNGAVDETHPVAPLSPYGATKLVGEQLADAAATAWGLSAASLRYFNVGGAGEPILGDMERQNLIPIVFDLVERGLRPAIFGADYPTPDGTCIRDYVHVLDVAEAHLAVLDALGAPGHRVLNIGTGTGTSVREIMADIAVVAGVTIDPEILPRRAGDSPVVIAVVERIREETGWTARYGLDDIVASAWRSWRFFSDTPPPSLGAPAPALKS
jgi:UDP-glucose 4-epimerase